MNDFCNEKVEPENWDTFREFIYIYSELSCIAEKKTADNKKWKDRSDEFRVEYIKLLMDKTLQNIKKGNLKEDGETHTFAEKNIAEAFVELMSLARHHNLKIASAITANLRTSVCQE
jgi:hypothetical protein